MVNFVTENIRFTQSYFEWRQILHWQKYIRHTFWWSATLRWRHNELDGVPDHKPHDCLLNRLFGRRSKKTSKLRVTGLCAGNSPGTGEFPAQMASYAENVSIWWRHHGGHRYQQVCQLVVISGTRATGVLQSVFYPVILLMVIFVSVLWSLPFVPVKHLCHNW